MGSYHRQMMQYQWETSNTHNIFPVVMLNPKCGVVVGRLPGKISLVWSLVLWHQGVIVQLCVPSATLLLQYGLVNIICGQRFHGYLSITKSMKILSHGDFSLYGAISTQSYRTRVHFGLWVLLLFLIFTAIGCWWKVSMTRISQCVVFTMNNLLNAWLHMNGV